MVRIEDEAIVHVRGECTVCDYIRGVQTNTVDQEWVFEW